MSSKKESDASSNVWTSKSMKAVACVDTRLRFNSLLDNVIRCVASVLYDRSFSLGIRHVRWFWKNICYQLPKYLPLGKSFLVLTWLKLYRCPRVRCGILISKFLVWFCFRKTLNVIIYHWCTPKRPRPQLRVQEPLWHIYMRPSWWSRLQVS